MQILGCISSRRQANLPLCAAAIQLRLQLGHYVNAALRDTWISNYGTIFSKHRCFTVDIKEIN